jgi:hypothetical protein
LQNTPTEKNASASRTKSKDDAVLTRSRTTSRMSTPEASSRSPTRPTLASIYHAKKSGRLEENSVEVLRQQFQTDIQKNVQQLEANKILNRCQSGETEVP